MRATHWVEPFPLRPKPKPLLKHIFRNINCIKFKFGCLGRMNPINRKLRIRDKEFKEMFSMS